MSEKNNSETNKNFNLSLKKGDLEAFNQLFYSNYNLLFNYILKLSNNSEIAKDVVQEAYIKLWEKRDTINPDLSVKHFLFKICHNEFLIYIRKKKKEESLLDELKYRAAYDTFSFHEETEHKKNQIEKALEKLPARTKEAFILSKYKRLKYKEIAIEMDISIKTVEKHISKALHFIKANVNSILF